MGLSQREKLLVLIGCVILIPMILFRFILQPMQQNQAELLNKISSLKNTIEQTHLLGQELLHLKKTTNYKPVSLSKRTESILRQEDLRSRSRIVLEEQPKGGQRLVLKLDEINLSQLSKLIYKIENTKPVLMIDSIDIGLSYKNKKLFRVSMSLISN